MLWENSDFIGNSYPPEVCGAILRSMEKLSRILELQGPLSTRDLRTEARSKNEVVDAARRCLADEGYIAIDTTGRSHTHHSLRPFREHPDTLTDHTDEAA